MKRIEVTNEIYSFLKSCKNDLEEKNILTTSKLDRLLHVIRSEIDFEEVGNEDVRIL